MTDIQASVIIPTHNRPVKLANLVASLREQDLPADAYEIVVVDDGSAPAVQLMQTDGPHCVVLRLEGVERSAARNAGAAAARGRIIIFVDDDATVRPDFIALHIRAHEEWKDALAVGAAILEPAAASTPFDRFRRRIEQNGVPPARGVVHSRNFCTAQNMSIDRHRFLALGGFEPTIVSGEDQDFAMRHTGQSGQIVYLPEAQAMHHDTLDFRRYCRRIEWGMAFLFPFLARYPDWPDNLHRVAVNGPIRLGAEPVFASVKKAVKWVLGRRIFVELLFGLTAIAERFAPRTSIPERLYVLLLGVHLRRGFALGVERFGASVSTAAPHVAALHDAR